MIIDENIISIFSSTFLLRIYRFFKIFQRLNVKIDVLEGQFYSSFVPISFLKFFLLILLAMGASPALF